MNPTSELQPVASLVDLEAFERAWRASVTGNEAAPATIYDALRTSSEVRPDAVALTLVNQGTQDENPQRASYRTLIDGVTRAANLFADVGGAGVGIAFLLPCLIETHYVLWGAETAGYAVPLNPFLTNEHLVELISASGARILVTAGSEYPEVWEKAVAVKEALPDLIVTCVGTPGSDLHPDIDFAAAMEDQDGSSLSFPASQDPHRVVAYFHTGGTTGVPKLVAQTHVNQLTAALGAALLLGIREGDCITNGMPLFHVGGTIPCSLSFFLQGAHVLMLSPRGFRNPAMIANIWRIVERFGATILGAVPTAMGALLSVPLDANIGSLRLGVTGASPSPPNLAERFAAITGKGLHELLGMTETGGVTAVDPAASSPTAGSVGIRLPFTTLRVRRQTADGMGDDCGPGEIGLLFVEGPHVSPGYLDETQNAGVFEGGGVNTGDLAYFDVAGRLYIAGRSKDLIIRSGHNIDPSMIEQAFMRHPAVDAAVAVGQPDRYAGELPVVFLTLRPGQEVTVDELQDFARSFIAERPAWPKQVYVVDALPTTAVGKPYKPALRAQAALRMLKPKLHDIAGDHLVDVSATDGGKRGLEISIRLKEPHEAIEGAIREELGGYVVSCSLAYT
ncbi:AMP-binding protein [Cupriavidus necator]|uniref:Acyl-CoA synthetase n=1 Tax=Cupriavidus necator TaxID=106590 RepID=A0A367PG28_CUPNE|nr:AMP-binding protein [Cupriavidus necator]QQX86614.1 AMP-binding protein [Cupriavidus necator]RCJ06809.1 acyl-CoA synthetase [Cupriavidus necator]